MCPGVRPDHASALSLARGRNGRRRFGRTRYGQTRVQAEWSDRNDLVTRFRCKRSYHVVGLLKARVENPFDVAADSNAKAADADIFDRLGLAALAGRDCSDIIL